MKAHHPERRTWTERRGGAERRVNKASVTVERRKDDERRSGLSRRVELGTPGEHINAAIGLVKYAAENGVMLEVDRWVLETAITRLHIALAKLTDKTH